MNDKIIYGTDILNNTKRDITTLIEQSKENGLRAPSLTTILVGDDYASDKYVKLKNKDCKDVGILTSKIRLHNVSEEDLISLIKEFNEDEYTDGILVQLPLPSDINEQRVMAAIHPVKDVDCFNPINVGRMYTSGYEPYLLHPCTPEAIIRLLEYMGYGSLEGLKAVVIGRSNIVGKPIAKLLLDKDATVTICHSKTKNIVDEVKQADIIIAATGQPKLVKSDWIKEGAIVIDVGINQDENGDMCGDVDFDDVIDKVKYITPVPKGVGLVTRAMLLENLMAAYISNIKRSK